VGTPQSSSVPICIDIEEGSALAVSHTVTSHHMEVVMKRIVRSSSVDVRSWMVRPPTITIHRTPNGKLVAVKCTGETVWEK